jgi:hypothetical protein
MQGVGWGGTRMGLPATERQAERQARGAGAQRVKHTARQTHCCALAYRTWLEPVLFPYVPWSPAGKRDTGDSTAHTALAALRCYPLTHVGQAPRVQPTGVRDASFAQACGRPALRSPHARGKVLKTSEPGAARSTKRVPKLTPT